MVIKFNHIPNYARLLVRRLWYWDQWLLVFFLRHRSWAAEMRAVAMIASPPNQTKLYQPQSLYPVKYYCNFNPKCNTVPFSEDRDCKPFSACFIEHVHWLWFNFRFDWNPRHELPEWRWAKSLDWISKTHFEVTVTFPYNIVFFSIVVMAKSSAFGVEK